jgi:hypothetical protein
MLNTTSARAREQGGRVFATVLRQQKTEFYAMRLLDRQITRNSRKIIRVEGKPEVDHWDRRVVRQENARAEWNG